MSNHIPTQFMMNCQFEYECPLDWDLLTPTDDPFVNFCGQCQKKVQLCTDDAQIDAAWENGQCIAYPMYSPELMKKIAEYEAGTGPWPFKEINMPIGLPGPRN